MAMFVLIGVSAVRQSQGTKKDYYLASHTVNPALVGLSAVATNNSGYMFIGVIGYTYHAGLASVWLMLGWIVGDYLASTFVHGKLRLATEQQGEVSYAAVLSGWHGQVQPVLRTLIAVITLIFLSAYASAQLVAGSKALHVLFDWPMWAGAVLGALMVIAYCYAGGIRASIWTDAAQSVVMITAMAVLLWVTVDHLGGTAPVFEQWSKIPGFLDWAPETPMFPGVAGLTLFAASWLFAGFSVIGQPQVMVRFMALSDHNDMARARRWYYLWFFLFYLMATVVGMLSRIALADSGTFDAELALPTLAMMMLPPVWVGLVLAGIFAATMSTADSLVLSCSAAVTHDLSPKKIEQTRVLKWTTSGITLLALAWAMLNKQTVFSLVILSWSSLASAFAPLLIVLALGGRPSQTTSVAALLSGFAAALLWRYLGWHDAAYEGMAGILVGLSVHGIGNRSQS
ncbi:MAG: sodium/proline symporter [Methylococcales bacterium]|nr:sodium/proline symporter [Methylococcales bacterium]